MAGMHPDDIEGYENATEGEKKVFRFIREVARPHKDFTCWYEPPVGSAVEKGMDSEGDEQWERFAGWKMDGERGGGERTLCDGNEGEAWG